MTLRIVFRRAAKSEEERAFVDSRTRLASEFKLTPAEQEERLPSGRQSRFANRVGWAKVWHMSTIRLPGRPPTF